MIAAQLLIILAGLYILVKGTIDFSKTRELVRPMSTFFGAIFIVIAFIPYIIPQFNNIFVVIVMSIMSIIVSYFFSAEKSAQAGN